METIGQAFVQTGQMSPQLWSLAAGAILLQIIIGIFVQLQTERLTEVYAQIEAIQTLQTSQASETADLYLTSDYFYINNAEIDTTVFTVEDKYFCYPEFTVSPGDTLNFSAMVSCKSCEDLII